MSTLTAARFLTHGDIGSMSSDMISSNGPTEYSNVHSVIHRVRSGTGVYFGDITRFANQGATYVITTDGLVFAGEVLSSTLLEKTILRRSFESLIGLLAEHGVSDHDGDPIKITTDTARAAKAFIRKLRHDRPWPKIAPDGEGGLMLVWENIESSTVITIDNWTLHVVRNAATEDAEYHDDLPFDGTELPEAVRKAIE